MISIESREMEKEEEVEEVGEDRRKASEYQEG